MEKHKSFIFNIGFILLLFIFNNIFISSILFLFGISISNFNFVITIFVTIIIALIILLKEKTSIRKIFLTYIIVSFLIISSIYISSKTFDNTWDGNTYHKSAIGALKNGWNPVYNDIESFDNKLNESNTSGIWNNHYAKGYWIYAANIYSVTNNIESGKSLNFIIILGTIFIVFQFLLNKIKLIYNVLISILISLNPVILPQVFSFYNDGVLGNLLLIIIVSLFLIINKEKEKNKIYYYILFIISLTIISNLKFTGLAYAGIYSMFFYIYVLLNKKQREKNLKSLTVAGIIGVALSVFLIGYSTYVKNFIDHGHPFYPLYGNGKVDIITNNAPKNFKDYNRFKKFYISNFSESDNISKLSGRDPKLKMPLTYSDEELKLIGDKDLRIGGYGVLFSGILIITIISLIINLILIYKKDKDKFKIYIIPLLATIFIALIVEDVWWARYFPQLYFIPFLAIILSFENKNNIIKKFINILILSLLIINISFFYERVINENYENFMGISKEFYNVNNSTKKCSSLIVNCDFFSGTIYNIDEKIDNKNLKIIKKYKNKENYNGYPVYNGMAVIYCVED